MSGTDWILIINAVAVFVAPVAALWIGGILRGRSDAQKAKLSIFATLIGLRHTPLSAELVQALNQIDAVFADDSAVREAWTRYYTALNDSNLNTSPGVSIREEKRRELLLALVKALRLSKKISSADLLRTYLPNFVLEDTHISMLERMQKRAMLEEELNRRHIPFPPCAYPGPVIPVPPLPQPSAGNGADQPR
jgi:hypothetical protein